VNETSRMVLKPNMIISEKALSSTLFYQSSLSLLFLISLHNCLVRTKLIRCRGWQWKIL